MTEQIPQLVNSKIAFDNIRGIVDLDQVAYTLSTLVDHVNKQNNVILNLERRLTDYVDQKVFMDKYNVILNSVTNIETRLNSLQIAATGRVHTKTVSAGDLSTANFERLQILSKKVDECITRMEVETQYQKLMEIRTTNTKIRSDLDNSVQRTDQLTKAHSSLTSKVQHMEAALSDKLDRSEVAYLESLTTKVELYDDFRLDSVAQLSQLQVLAKDTTLRITDQEYHLQGIDAYFLKLDNEIALLASKAELSTVSQNVEMLQRQQRLCATQELVTKLEDTLRHAQQNIQQCENKMLSIDTTIKNCQDVLKIKANIRDVQSCVPNRVFEDVVLGLGNEVSACTPLTVSEKLHQQLESLIKRVNEESERTSIAVRFVDWFTNRGENFEHNMKVIDRHLKSLVTPESKSRLHNTAVLPIEKIRYNSYNEEDIEDEEDALAEECM